MNRHSPKISAALADNLSLREELARLGGAVGDQPPGHIEPSLNIAPTMPTIGKMTAGEARDVVRTYTRARTTYEATETANVNLQKKIAGSLRNAIHDAAKAAAFKRNL